MSETRMKVIYKTAFPNGKIYVGSDLTDTVTYFGSFDSSLVAVDFTAELRRDFVLRKKILRESSTAADQDARDREMKFIRALPSNNPSVGYNRNPPFHEEKELCEN